LISGLWRSPAFLASNLREIWRARDDRANVDLRTLSSRNRARARAAANVAAAHRSAIAVDRAEAICSAAACVKRCRDTEAHEIDP
jgi:hypothetical protein